MKIRFAVADDAAFLRELIKNLVSSEGHIFVGEADNGDEAIRLVDRTLPDLIFLDMVMPIKNGLQTATTIKEFHPDVKIIGCSTLDDQAMMQKAMQAGFDAYIVKPFTKEQIFKTIIKVLPQLGESTDGRV